ncbi:hypothetical protein HB816_07540 [Listeria booriae]|uniref:hypothetical protein n=1 Tax=Listeria booriae TaxID=1552123 RepID=UPI001628B924|nr:hypothetical protein [Listeria booriae]MBC1230292.1 hypothetical protein [Listeria booriae]
MIKIWSHIKNLEGEEFEDLYFSNYDIGIRGLFYHKDCPSIFLLPGRWQNSKDFTFSNPYKDIKYYLLSKKYNVFIIDYRSTHLHCKKKFDLFTLDDFVEDIEYLINFIDEELKLTVKHILGFSLGASFAFLLNPHIYQILTSLIILDGGILRKYERNESIQYVNPAWNKDYRKYNSHVQTSSVQYKLSGDKFFPENLLNQFYFASKSTENLLQSFGRNISSIKLPILLLYAGKQPHRSVLTANLTQSIKIKKIYLFDTNHLDMYTSTFSRYVVFPKIKHWLEGIK